MVTNFKRTNSKSLVCGYNQFHFFGNMLVSRMSITKAGRLEALMSAYQYRNMGLGLGFRVYS